MIQIPALWQFVVLLAVHWVADFVCQTHWQASNKSKNNDALVRHVAAYTAILGVVSIILFGRIGFLYAVLNGILHLATDYVTSRISSRLFMAQFDALDIVTGPPFIPTPRYPPPVETRLAMKKNFNPHYFFVVIGFDQLIHQVTLAGTLAIIIQ
jgi:Protein of unknown function (DUF3307)